MEDEIKILNEIIITPLVKAHKTLDTGIAKAKTELEKDGVIQRFEYTYELLWKTLKRILEYKGIPLKNPRDIFRESAIQGLIDNPEFWFEVIRKRNLTTHTYSEDYSYEIYEFLPEFNKEVSNIITTLKSL